MFWRVFRFCPRLCFGPKKTLPGERPASGYQFILGAVCRQVVWCALWCPSFFCPTQEDSRGERVLAIGCQFISGALCFDGMVAGTSAFLACALFRPCLVSVSHKGDSPGRARVGSGCQLSTGASSGVCFVSVLGCPRQVVLGGARRQVVASSFWAGSSASCRRWLPQHGAGSWGAGKAARRQHRCVFCCVCFVSAPGLFPVTETLGEHVGWFRSLGMLVSQKQRNWQVRSCSRRGVGVPVGLWGGSSCFGVL